MFIPIATSIASILAVALTYETGKSAKRTFDRKKRRNERDRS